MVYVRTSLFFTESFTKSYDIGAESKKPFPIANLSKKIKMKKSRLFTQSFLEASAFKRFRFGWFVQDFAIFLILFFYSRKSKVDDKYQKIRHRILNKAFLIISTSSKQNKTKFFQISSEVIRVVEIIKWPNNWAPNCTILPPIERFYWHLFKKVYRPLLFLNNFASSKMHTFSEIVFYWLFFVFLLIVNYFHFF